MVFESRNANKSYILSEFAEVLRNFIRAVASVNNHQAAMRAAIQMHDLMKVVGKCKEDITWQEMFDHAVHVLTDYEAKDREWQIYATARDGMSLFTELSCGDGFAGARISQREHQFIRMMESVLTWNDPPPRPIKRKKRD